MKKRRLLAILIVLMFFCPVVVMTAPAHRATATTAGMGAVTVSGTDFKVNGSAVSAGHFRGIDETTALIYAMMYAADPGLQIWYWYGGKNQNFPSANGAGRILAGDPNDMWNKYFTYCNYYDINLVRMGAFDEWGTGIMYSLWHTNAPAFEACLETMLSQAYIHHVYVTITIAGAGAWPTYSYGAGTGKDNPFGVMPAGSEYAYNYYLDYAQGVLAELNVSAYRNAIFSVDLYNEPDGDNIYLNWWHGLDISHYEGFGQLYFRFWARSVHNATDGYFSGLRELGTACGGYLFNFSESAFDLCQDTYFSTCHVHIYGWALDSYLITERMSWASALGKPLLIGELGNNSVYPIIRWMAFENMSISNGVEAVISLTLLGTPGYPHTIDFQGHYLSYISAMQIQASDKNYQFSANGSQSAAYDSLLQSYFIYVIYRNESLAFAVNHYADSMLRIIVNGSWDGINQTTYFDAEAAEQNIRITANGTNYDLTITYEYDPTDAGIMIDYNYTYTISTILYTKNDSGTFLVSDRLVAVLNGPAYPSGGGGPGTNDLYLGDSHISMVFPLVSFLLFIGMPLAISLKIKRGDDNVIQWSIIGAVIMLVSAFILLSTMHYINF